MSSQGPRYTQDQGNDHAEDIHAYRGPTVVFFMISNYRNDPQQGSQWYLSVINFIWPFLVGNGYKRAFLIPCL